MGPHVCPVHLNDGTLCGRVTPCPLHPRPDRTQNRRRIITNRQPKEDDGALQPPVAQRDLHALGWWLIEQVFLGDNQGRRDQFAIAATLMRVLATLGPGDVEAGPAARETELRARLLHGQVPRDDGEWALARSLFDDAALTLLAALAQSGESDGGDRGQPLRWIEGGADEVDLTGARQHEER